jgi:hypothetical protein
MIALWSFVAIVGAFPPQPRFSSCGDCHIANPQADPLPPHTSDWDMSAHGRNGVGCERCHLGDSTTFEPFLAHRGVLTSRNPASPVHRVNLPRTCGACHAGPFVAFQRSKHFQLLQEGREGGPTCSTCHGPVAARLLSPRALEKQCERCHGPQGAAPREGFSLSGGILLEEVQAVREILAPVPRWIDRIEDSARRGALEEAHRQAQAPLTEAVSSAHAFVFDQMRERLRTARERAEALVDKLVSSK